MQSKLKLAIKEAYYRGYRVNEECMLITPNNRMRKLCIGKEGYPLFNIRIMVNVKQYLLIDYAHFKNMEKYHLLVIASGI